jgi:hypothetical protein
VKLRPGTRRAPQKDEVVDENARRGAAEVTRRSADFYRNLPPRSSLAEALEGRLHADMPRDWWIAVADVAASTQAIESGAYKKVNTVGVACIAAVVNVDRGVDLPFVFGGDGATLAMPERLRERAESALRGAQRLARDRFGLTLRVGMVRVGDLTDQGYWVRIAKVRLSPHVTQPTLSGRGWEEAERRVKTAGVAGVRRLQADDEPAQASFEGFECRWQGVPNFNGHKLALLVAAVSPDAEGNLATYQRVLEKIHEIYGEVAQYHPLRADRMRLTFDPRLLGHEWRVRSAHFNWMRRTGYFMRMLLQNLAGVILFSRNMDTESVRWSRYRDELVENSDFRKFDGMLRMVMDGSDAQADQLQAHLETEYRARRLVYGMHKSREALLTCIVQSYNGDHLHFIDGSDGGYALAARQLKARLAAVLHPPA